MQIRTRLTLQFIAISAALLLSAMASIYFFAAKIQREDFFQQLQTRASTTADLLIRVEAVDSNLLKLIDVNKKDVLNNENISVYDAANQELYTNNDSLRFTDLLEDMEGFLQEVRTGGTQKRSLGDLDLIGINYRHNGESFVVLASAIDLERQKNLKTLRRVLLLVFVIFLLAIAFAGWLYAGRALKPISAVIRQVNTISANNLNLRIDEGNKTDEIARLTMTFNDLLNRVEHAFKTQKTFVSNASHELRNPLTAITSQLEVTLMRTRSQDDYQRVLLSVLDDIRRLNEMSHRLLVLAKIESDPSSIKLEPLRLDDLVWETKNEFLANNPTFSVQLTLHDLPETENRLLIAGNPVFLKTCFLNLMDNACKFSTDHTVSIAIFSRNESLIVKFSDQGIGIESTELPYIFEPFYRGKNTSHVNGYGVGLSIVDRIMRMHQGEIQVASTLHEGTVITLIFPHF